MRQFKPLLPERAKAVEKKNGKNAPKRWKKMPTRERQHATLHPDSYAGYDGMILQAQPQASKKKTRKTNQIERFNGTLRQ